MALSRWLGVGPVGWSGPWTRNRFWVNTYRLDGEFRCSRRSLLGIYFANLRVRLKKSGMVSSPRGVVFPHIAGFPLTWPMEGSSVTFR